MIRILVVNAEVNKTSGEILMHFTIPCGTLEGSQAKIDEGPKDWSAM